jgi:hypothetical protein
VGTTRVPNPPYGDRPTIYGLPLVEPLFGLSRTRFGTFRYPVLRQMTTATTNQAVSQTFTLPTLPNSLLVLTTCGYQGGNVTSISGGGVDSWTEITDVKYNYSQSSIWVGLVTSPGSTSITANGTTFSYRVFEWLGLSPYTFSTQAQTATLDVSIPNVQLGLVLAVQSTRATTGGNILGNGWYTILENTAASYGRLGVAVKMVTPGMIGSTVSGTWSTGSSGTGYTVSAANFLIF